jgi:hypothetical protein
MTDRIVLLGVLLVACDRPVDTGTGYRLVADAPTEPITALDVLFVVDNSGAMAEEQEALASGTAGFIATLDERVGRRLDLHIGVTSTNAGTGPSGGGGDSCAGDGDEGRLLVRPECPPLALDLPFLVDVADPTDPDGPRTINYPAGQLAETLACMSRLGTNGCGFEQQLEAMRRALDRLNGGFLRQEAMLLVVLVTDEDDCSAFDRAVYDPTEDDRDEPLGELSSFRCFDFGVTCDQPDARVPGDRTGCVPRVDSPYLEHPDEYAEFLRALKGGPGMVMVAAITGERAPVAVYEDETKTPAELSVVDHCPEPDQLIPWGAGPAIRIHGLLDALPRHAFSPICQRDAGALARLADSAASNLLGSRCLWATPHDGDDERAGIQPVCRAELRLESGDWIQLPSCDQDDTGQSCFEVAEDRELCGWTESRLAVIVDGLTLPGERVRVECLQARDGG